ncbi:MAG: AAA family ATPase [Thermodesulfovibrionia bacterium]|nr:AAA family ATPase [Thermodesulfovibrionia bacterium]
MKEVFASVKGFYLKNSDSTVNSDLLIMEIGEDLDKEFELIHNFQNSNTAGEIFLTSSLTDPDILIQSLRAGAKEFFIQPIKRDEVKEALINFLHRKKHGNVNTEKHKQGKIINVIGTKGGVGTTTVAVNLAACLKELNGVQSVALIDMNNILGEIPLFLDINPAFNWGEVAKNISRLDSTYLMSILSKHQSGIYVLPSPTELDGNAATPEITDSLLSLMQTEFDFIVIDSGQSLDDISFKILELSDTVLLVSILSLPCLINAKRFLDTFWKIGYPQEEQVKIIINRYQKDSVISLKEAEESINKKFFWHIPNDYSTTVSSINQGKTLSMVAKKAEVSKNLRDLASIFLTSPLFEKEEKKKEKNGFFGLKFIKSRI